MPPNTSHAAALPSLQPGDLLDEREAAALLHAEVGTLRNWRAANKGPRYFKVGKRLVRYHRADLQAFIDGSDKA